MRTVSFLLAACAVCATSRTGFADDTPVGPPSARTVLSACDHLPLFAYGSWERRVVLEDGAWRIAGDGLTGQGGCGENLVADLSAHASGVLRLRLRSLPGNGVDRLRVQLRDADGTSATFRLVASATAVDDWQDLFPVDGVGLSDGVIGDDSRGADGRLDLARIVQWQLQGEWQKEPLAVRVGGVTVAAPDESVREARAAADRRRRDAEDRLRQERAAARATLRRGPHAPRVTHVSLAAPDILEVQVEAGRVLRGALLPYVAQAGDERRVERQADGRQSPQDRVVLVRDGHEVGTLIGPERAWLSTYEGFEGDALATVLADDPASYALASDDDPAYRQVRPPLAVHRKSKPVDWQLRGNAFVLRHHLYLRLPAPLREGAAYTLRLDGLNTAEPTAPYVHQTARTRSESVHASQIGFRPDDPCKRAFLSLWMGTGGGGEFVEGAPFHVLDDATGVVAFSGRVAVSRRADKSEAMRYEQNWNKTSVYRLDFGALDRPGRYRIHVEGLGCSYPFDIAADVWERAFRTQMQGLYNNRSGVALDAAVAGWSRPRSLHPDDGHVATWSTWAYNDGGHDSRRLAAGDTGVPVPEAWGGYHDAGDWNPRRVTHLRVTLLALELFDLFPNYFGALSWGVPREAERLPDLLNECLFELELFRRLQRADGAVSYGLETEGDPIAGEVSWLQSMPQYVYAPDAYASFYYAAVAARAARLFGRFDPERSAQYRDSALRAAAWGEADYQERLTEGRLHDPQRETSLFRAFAALELFRLTADPAWHARHLEDDALRDPDLKPFEKGGVHRQDAVFAYACLDDDLAEPERKRHAVAATAREADLSLDYARGNAFNLTHWHRAMPMFLGFYSVPGAQQLVRAHYLTGRSEYLHGSVQATLFPSGANPNNMTYTSGVGANPPRNVLLLDARTAGGPTPRGFTVYGNCDYLHYRDNNFFTWPVQWFLGRECVPSAWDWPIPEAYFDIFKFAAQNEFTMDQTMGPNAYVWGYLAARPATVAAPPPVPTATEP